MIDDTYTESGFEEERKERARAERRRARRGKKPDGEGPSGRADGEEIDPAQKPAQPESGTSATEREKASSERASNQGRSGADGGAEDGISFKAALKQLFKGRRNRRIAVASTVVLAIVVVGAGLLQWHNTSGFCVAICHSPMNETYLDTLYANPYEPATDKWGNEVSQAGAMLASSHGNMGKKCMDCHEPSLEEQVTEGLAWIQGDYYNPLSERDLARLVYYRGAGETEFCLNSDCHDLDKSELTAQTADMDRNPHSWHHSEYTCSDCHKAHRASIMVCSQCHPDSEIPLGWLTWEEAKDLDTQYMQWNDEQFLES